jgi:uncharacterized phage protein (TIGR02216 family)
MKRLDWPALIKLGVQALGLRPNEFWDLTPAEFRLMLGDRAQGGPLTRSGLDDLMKSYPD